ncbi:Histone-lysine N-methyltransferase SETMAR [Eumeta japonica]|uniref:Histone-lysine N-methyltransferase SETMAR n=1 Tax=Eumeta variegata TaxID=151549 RepID=A0A4C1SFD4_EUMVA|nr:Histone-lysine N-methyltransferase SETMAR [Eumeta japonica]
MKLVYCCDIIGNKSSKQPRWKKNCEIEEEDMVNERTAQRWFNRFDIGDSMLVDESRFGCPSEWDVEATKQAVESQSPTKSRWLDKGQLPQSIAERGRFEPKVLLSPVELWRFSVFGNNSRTITGEIYSEQVKRTCEALSQRYAGLVDQNGCSYNMIMLANITVKVTRDNIEELRGTELLSYAVFSPLHASSNHYLYRSMPKFIRGKVIEYKGEIENALREFFASKPKEWFYGGLRDLAEPSDRLVIS